MKYVNVKIDVVKYFVFGYYYFKIIYLFMNNYCIIREIFFEYFKGVC